MPKQIDIRIVSVYDAKGSAAAAKALAELNKAGAKGGGLSAQAAKDAAALSKVATAAAKGSAASAKTTAFISAKAPAVSAAGGISMLVSMCAHHMQPCTRKRETQE